MMLIKKVLKFLNNLFKRLYTHFKKENKNFWFRMKNDFLYKIKLLDSYIIAYIFYIVSWRFVDYPDLLFSFYFVYFFCITFVFIYLYFYVNDKKFNFNDFFFCILIATVFWIFSIFSILVYIEYDLVLYFLQKIIGNFFLKKFFFFIFFSFMTFIYIYLYFYVNDKEITFSEFIFYTKIAITIWLVVILLVIIYIEYYCH